MTVENNSSRDIEIRKSRDILRTIGTGIIVFGTWSVIKSISLMLFGASDMNAEAGSMIADAEQVDPIFTTIIALFMMAVSLGVRLYIGRSAIAVSKGGSRGVLYIVLTFMMICGSILTLIMIGVSIVTSYKAETLGSEDGIFSGVIIEITSLILMIEMVTVSIRLRKLSRQEARDAA